MALLPHPTRQRDPWLDNARFILIALVMFGHLLEPLDASQHWLSACYAFIYAFHMPAFAFVSGAVAHATLDTRQMRSTAFRLIWPYLVFQGLYALAALLPWWPDIGPQSLITPYWLLWYLVSLACWRFLLPFFAHLRGSLAIAIAVAVGAGCLEHIGYDFSLSRTLVFFPLFLIGWRWAPRWREFSRSPRMRLLAVAVLVGMFATAWNIPLDPRWLYGSYGYAALDANLLAGAGVRLILLGVAICGTLAVTALVPRRHTPISQPGSRSLGAYVLQGFVINFAVGAGVFSLVGAWSGWQLVPVLILIAVGTVWVLSTSTVQRLLAPISTPHWLERLVWKKAPLQAHDASPKPGSEKPH